MGAALTNRDRAVARRLGRQKPELRLVKPIEDPAVEQRLSRLLVEKCIKLREKKGERFRFPITKEQPHRVLDELDLMLECGEISRALFEAGKRYGDSYRMANFVGVYRCGLNLTSRSGRLGQQDIAAHRVKDYSYLQSVRLGAFGDCSRELVRLCDDICGNEFRIDVGRDSRPYAVEVMTWLLTRLAYFYGILWWHDGPA